MKLFKLLAGLLFVFAGVLMVACSTDPASRASSHPNRYPNVIRITAPAAAQAADTQNSGAITDLQTLKMVNKGIRPITTIEKRWRTPHAYSCGSHPVLEDVPAGQALAISYAQDDKTWELADPEGVTGDEPVLITFDQFLVNYDPWANEELSPLQHWMENG